MRRGVPLAADWEIEVLAAEAGTALVRLPAKPVLLRPGNTVSGPALMGLADVAMWAALLSTTEGRDDSVTSTMTVNFLRPAGSGAVLAEARMVKRGRPAGLRRDPDPRRGIGRPRGPCHHHLDGDRPGGR